MVIRFMASHCNFFSFALQSIPSASKASSQSTLATTNLTRTSGESELVSRLHHVCIESARIHPLLAASFIRKAALTDDGSHRRKRCLTWPPHMSWVTPSKIQRCGKHWEYGNLRQLWSWYNCIIMEHIWNIQLQHRGTYLEYGNPTGRAATPWFAMQHTLAAGSWTGWLSYLAQSHHHFRHHHHHHHHHRHHHYHHHYHPNHH